MSPSTMTVTVNQRSNSARLASGRSVGIILVSSMHPTRSSAWSQQVQMAEGPGLQCTSRAATASSIRSISDGKTLLRPYVWHIHSCAYPEPW